METKFLGFGCGKPWSMSMVLISSSEALICTDLKREAWIAWTVMACDAVGFKSKNKQGYCGSVLCMYETSLLCIDVCLMP